MNELISQKQNLRKILINKRDSIKKNSSKEFDAIAFDELKKYINFKEIQNIASFISIRSEISTNLLNKKIIELKKKLSFPVIERNSKELIFKRADLNNSFKLGKFNIPEPENESEEIIPQLFFVPCLGFDLNGYRIGYGGGFYDKTFAKLKKLNFKFNTVGFAFDNQMQSKLPRESFDYKLDFVLTEKQLYKFV
ncbi:5-formyltetrahydrofolate cyclo-ligase [Pelagibacteraceae bacterium]|nr:5-formyltetrahydrofolate cyclo-ligase [Pelagibacteraceae bacterium]